MSAPADGRSASDGVGGVVPRGSSRREPPPGSFPWGQLILVSAIPMSAMGAILNFAPLLPLVREEFGITNAWAGMLASSAILAHTLMQLPGGQVADGLGAKRAIGLGLSLIALSVLASGLAPNLPLLLLCRFALGAGTAISFIAGLSFINTVISPGRRVVAQGMFGAAGNLGVLLVLLLSERVAAVGGWRGAFVLEGVLILALVPLSMRRLLPDGKRLRATSPSWSETLRHSHLYLLGLAHVLTYGIFMALATWIATFLWQSRGVGLEWAGPLAAFLALSGVAGRALGGVLSVGRERQVVLLSCFATAFGTLLVPLLPTTPATVLGLLLAGWFASVPFGAIFSYASLISERGTSGRDFSLINFVANVGALVFPPLVGCALDAAESFVLGFGVVGAVGIVGSVAVALWLPRPTPSGRPSRTGGGRGRSAA